MNAKYPVSHPPLGSDLAGVDAHEIQPEEYEEIPELTEEMLAIAVIKKPVSGSSPVYVNAPMPHKEPNNDDPV
ncbi:hypothetical protein NHH73_10550 [Oxalobacteraceae bacterium OTU3CINTB1]|nr:hypothetical protein NHH73_10550 [Oxalobacteraceae bacterium OTU3CINTB1]